MHALIGLRIHQHPARSLRRYASKSSGMSRPTRFHCSSFGNRISLNSRCRPERHRNQVYRQVRVFQYFVTSKFVLDIIHDGPLHARQFLQQVLPDLVAPFEENPIFCRCPSFGSVR